MADEERKAREPTPLPPARSGPKVMIVTAALVLAFLGILWYATFAALHTRGPDRAFFAQDSWENGTLSLYVNDLDTAGVVPLDSLTARLVTQDNQLFYQGALGQTVQLGNWSLTVTLNDRDGSGTLTKNDDLNLTASPAAAADNFILTTFYLYSDGKEWSHFPIPLV